MVKKITTDPTKALVPIKARTNKMQTVVNALVINNERGLNDAARIRAGIKAVAKEIDEKKKEITQPLNLALKNVRGLFVPLEEACEKASRAVDSKVLDYHQKISKEREEAEAKLAKRVDNGTMKMSTAAKKMEELPEAQRSVITENGGLKIIKIKKFRIIDLAKIPLEYIQPNEPEIRRAMYAGTEISGVEYYTEDIIQGQVERRI